MRIPSRIQFADKKVEKAFEELKNVKGDERQLYEWLVRAFNDIEENAFCGVQIPKRLIPRRYVQKYNVKNLWKYDLPNAWRLLYSLVGEQVLVISIILEWMNHKDYEKRFGY